jgi:kumamolisin
LSSQIILKGSQREHPKDSVFLGKPHADERGSITCVLRRKHVAPRSVAIQLSHEDFAVTHGCDIQDIHAVENFAAEQGFTVDRIDSAARTMKLSGNLNQMAEVFGASLEMRKLGEATYRTRGGSLTMPPELGGIVIAILGFDERPVARTKHQVLARAGQSSYTPNQVAKAYNFPNGTGSEQTIAIIELGGGYNQSDLSTYWRQVGAGNVCVTAIGVDGATNAPTGDPGSADGEVALDIEVVGAIAPAARIAVYFTENTDQGFLNAINAAIHDPVRKPSVISISWGGPESSWTSQSLDAFNAAFHDAALLGITVCAAAGDNGSDDGVGDGGKHVDFPASSPWVLGCGGTRLSANGGKIVSEIVWNDGAEGGATGGGISAYFPIPSYQKNIKLPSTGRGVPDVAGNADPQSGYLTIVDGQSGVIGGTSAVAPLWSALIALCNEELGKNVGWIHPYLYGAAFQAGAFHDITHGNNGAYSAGKGWDACTGLGSPDGQALLTVLKNALK